MKKIILTFMMFCVVFYSFGQVKYIAFLEQPNKETPQYGLHDALTNSGYIVDIFYTPFNYTELATYDLVIIGRLTTSSDFTDASSWNTLDVPVLVLNGFCVRDSRLKLINGVINNVPDGTLVDPSTVINALPVANADGTYDKVFDGVTTGASFPYYTWFYDYIGSYKADYGEGLNTGKVLAVLPDDATGGGAGAAVMVRWEPETETYPGAGVHANYRTYMNLGTEDALEASKNFSNYTDQSLKLFNNEVAFLLNPLSTGLQAQQTESQVNVYPIPSTDGNFTLEMKAEISKTANVRIYTMTGILVYDENFESSGSISINSGLTKGIYLLECNAGENKSTKKIVVN